MTSGHMYLFLFVSVFVYLCQYIFFNLFTGGSIKISNTLAVKDLQVALCLQRRQDICSSLKPSVIGQSCMVIITEL